MSIGVDESYPFDGDYELSNDIDCSGINWLSIGGRHTDHGGANVFGGTLDGRYYTISNLTYFFFLKVQVFLHRLHLLTTGNTSVIIL